MSAPAARALLLVTLCALSPPLTAHRPLRPRNVKLTSVDRGLKVTWDPPNELDGRPVDRYSIGYGKSMRTLRFITVDKDQRSEVLEDVEPGVLHYLKMSAENEEGLSKPVYRAETPGGGEWVKLDGFAVVSGSPVNSSSTGSIRTTSPARPAPPALASRQIAPQSSSGPDPPRRSGYLPIRSLNKHKVDVSQHQADQRNGNKPNLASESVYVVSLQAQRPQARSAPVHKALVTKKITPEPEDVDEVKDITVRVMSAQSVLISWVDPVIEKKKNLPEGSRHYTVRYREKGESARWEYKETTQRRLMIETLSADGMYEFSIRVSQGNTDKKWSASVFQRTPESAPSGPPENFQVKPIRGKGTAVTVTWDSPEEPNGRIREYILSYAPALKPFGAKSVTYRGTTTSAVVDGLQPGEHYIFKIRAANRRGQGPQSKAFSLAVPETSTADSTSSSHSKKLNKPISSNRDSSSPQDTQNTDSLTTTAPPTTRRTRPLSQTRSYHSIFSSVRGSVRNGALNPKTVVRSPQIPNRESNLQKEEEKEKAEMPIVTPKVDLVKANEAIEDTVEPETMNNKDTSLNEEDMEYSRASSDTTNSSSNLKKQSPYPDREDTSPSSSDTLSKRQEGRRITHLTPRQSSIPDSSRLRRPISRTRMRNRDSSSLSHTQESPAITKDHTPKASSHSEGKDYNNVVRHTDLSTSAPTTKKTTVAPQKESSSGSSRGSSPVHRITGPRSGSSFSGGREKDDIEHKPDSSAAATLSQPTQPRRSDDTNSQSKSIQDTRVDQDSDHHNHMSPKVETAKSEPPPSTDHTDTSESTSRKTENPERGEKNPNPGTSPLLPSRTNSTGRGSSLSFPSRSSRIGAGSRVPTRQDGRFPWSRTASSASVGAGRPILRGTPSRAATSETQAARDRAKASTTSSSSGDGVDSHSAKDAVSDTASSKNLQTLSNSQTNANNPILSGNTKGNNAAEDDLSAGVKESYDSLKHTSTVSTAQPKTTSSTVGPPQRLDKTVNESVQRNVSTTRTRSQFPPTYPRKPLLGSNGRFRSPVLSSRLNGSRFPGKLQPLQHTRLGSSSSVLTQPDSNGRLGPVSRSSLRQTPSSENPHDGTSTSKGTLESSQSSSQPARNPVVGSRLRYPGRADTISRGKSPISGNKPSNEQGKNGRPNLTASNGKMSSTSDENIKSNGVRHIIGPDGTKWVIDLDKGVLMNENGKVLQDSRGRPKRVVLGEDGKTIFDEQGSPLVNQEGLALFGHSRDSRPVVNPKEKYLTLGGKSVVGLDQPKPSTTTTTTTPEPTMEPTTTEFTTIESTTMSVVPTCPPGTFSRLNDEGFPVMDADGVLDCYPDDDGSGMEMDSMVTITMAPDNALDVEEGEFFIETTLPPTTTPTTPEPRTPVPRLSKGPSSQLDAAGKKRFTAPYVNYIQKDPGSPCSLTEALEYLQVDVLENLMKKDILASQKQQPPKNKPHNITVVAMEGCHSFIILDWARPLKDDMVSGYMVHSASYDDVLNNRWSSRAASGTHLSVENLKPNSRYYFKVQAKNTFGLGPISDTFEYITESDDPLLIERPPGGEPIWIPFTFKYNPAHSACKGSQYVKRTWYRKFVGVVLCNSLRYKIFMGDGLKDTFYSVADTFGSGEDHCQFVDSYLDGRTGAHLSMFLPTAQGYYRSYRQEPVSFGSIGRRTPHPFVGWYECGVPIPGKW